MRISKLLSELRPSIRLLIVADGRIHFGPSDDGFTLLELLTILTSDGTHPWPSLDITTARRDGDPLTCNCTRNDNFRFDGDLFLKGEFHEVWLFGDKDEADPPLDDIEVEAVLEFMNKGGGVFATGDHESIGAAMCGKLPRVSSMRKWFFRQAKSLELKAPGQEDATRLDTLREGLDLGFQVDDQSDAVPQEIRPKFFLTDDGKGAKPHPLLADESGFAITVLPDHMHEGECMVPTNLESTFPCKGEQCDEYPIDSNMNPPARLAPQVVAISTSASGYMRIIGKSIPPVEPRSFVSMVAYDGDLVGVGRVAVDSSFHHFIDINLRGRGASNPERRGFFDEQGNPTKDYITFTKFYNNLVRWLSPKTFRARMYEALLADLRFNTFLIEDLRPIPAPSLRDYVYAGVLTRKAITERLSDTEAIQCALSLISGMPAEIRRPVESLINPWLPSSLTSSALNLLLNADFFLNAYLGAAMLALTNKLPLDQHEALQTLGKTAVERTSALSSVVNSGLGPVSSILARALQQSAERINSLSQGLSNVAP